MPIRACLIIPVYNHGGTVGTTVAKLRGYGVPIYLIDDGSDAATQRQLEALAVRESLVRLSRLPVNGGKGAAVMHGLRRAYAEGFTHALQIDADGQHDAADVPRFLLAAEANPEAVVCGAPIYDASVPKARRYGRYVTHIWVWIETLSFAVKDSMCGFRVYPLATACRVIDGAHVPTRMDFDAAIFVRLCWAGAPVINISTRVTYPVGGVSHFDMWRDNLRISRTHARLFFGMLSRLPILLWRRVAGGSGSVHWARLSERGSYAGMMIVLYTYRLLGAATARALLYPITAYFFLTNRRSRHASYDYLRRVYAYAGPTPVLAQPPRSRDSWRHMFAFAEASLDKMAAWLGQLDYSQIDFPNEREMDALVASGRGAVLIGAHLGNWEMSRAFGHFSGYRAINAVVYTEHARRFNRLLERANADFRVNLVPVTTIGPDTAMLLQGKIDRGELLVIVGDRTPPGERARVVEVPFLGQTAAFAQGPFIVAALLGCPVYLFFCLREGGRYRVYFERFADRVELPRARREEALRGYAQRYARELERHCVRAPYQWFNFYDYWALPRDRAAPADVHTSELDHAKSGRV